MSSMSRSIRRNRIRNIGRAVLAAGRMKCPKCGKKLTRKGLSFRKVQCVGCGFTGSVK